VVLRTVADTELRRDLWAKSCDELVRAVGFVISVTYDPPSPDVLESIDEASAPSSDATTVATKANPPASVTVVRPQPPSANPEFDVKEQADGGVGQADGAQWRIGLGGTAGWGVAPSPLWGAAGFAAMSWGPAYGAGGVLRIALEGDFSRAEGFSGGVATFRRWSGALALGPEWHLGAAHLGVAVTGRAGLIQAQGRSTLEPKSYDRPWLEAGAAVLGRVELVAGCYLEADLAVSKPLTRYAFQFDPVVFHRVSSWLTHVGIAASAAF
jgi:hypothetical protein